MTSSVIGRNVYSVFGLTVRSEIPLPELIPAAGTAEPDVTIRVSTIEDSEKRPGLHNSGDGLLLVVEGVGRFTIERGCEVIIEPAPRVPDRNLRLYLLGSAFGALLHQRGALPLHANAVAIDGRAVAFIGESGSGKSTLAAWFHDRGYKILADDVCVIGFDEGGIPHAYPGLPRLRLWHEALSWLGRDTAGYERSYVGAAEPLEKFDVPIARAGVAGSPAPLAAVYRLERGDEFSITELTGVEAAEALFANTYRGGYVSMVKGQKGHWDSAIRLVRAVPVHAAVRQWDLSKLEDQCCRLVEHAKRSAAVEGHASP